MSALDLISVASWRTILLILLSTFSSSAITWIYLESRDGVFNQSFYTTLEHTSEKSHHTSQVDRVFFSDLVVNDDGGERSRLETAKLMWELNTTLQMPGFLLVRAGGNKAEHFGVSMFHQLHCVQALKGTFRSLRDQSGEHPYMGHKLMRRDADTERELKATIHPDHINHLDHCLDYLAQVNHVSHKSPQNAIADRTKGILCAADDTLEPSSIETGRNGKPVRAVNGVGIQHQCRDSQAIREAVQRSEETPVILARKLRIGDTVMALIDGRA